MKKLLFVVALTAAPLAFAQNIGPSTSTAPYMLPSVPQASTTSILTVGDTIGGYRMVGIPDGMGAFNNPTSGSFTVMMNHELGGGSGAVRAHGQTGSFVSRWDISANLTVNSGRDHNTSSADAYEYSGGTWSNAASPAQQWARFCSGNLAAPSAFRFGNLGTDARIYMNGEESGAEGRAYAHIASGPAANQTWALPHLGRFSWENSVASPYAQQKTIVIGLDDSTTNGQVYTYIGNKTNTGNDIDRAGLTNGSLYGIRALGVPQQESRSSSFAPGTRFDLVSQGSVPNMTGAALDSASAASGVTSFLRPEDGNWDPRAGKQNDFYFVTTDRFDQAGQVGRSRLYRLRYDDINNPLAGGTVDELLSTADGPQMMDNITVDSHGRIFIQEDVGGNARLGKIWMYDIDSENLVEIAAANPTFFQTGASNFLTIDEEASGIIDAKDQLGDGWFLMDMQAHYGIPGELVEGGQMLAMYVDPSYIPEPSSLALIALGGLALIRRR